MKEVFLVVAQTRGVPAMFIRVLGTFSTRSKALRNMARLRREHNEMARDIVEVHVEMKFVQ